MDPSNYNMMFPNGTAGYGGGYGGGDTSGSQGGATGGNWWQNSAMDSGLGGIGAGLMGLLDPGQNPSDAASQYYNQIPGVYQKYLNPYNQMGQQAGQNLQGQYSQLENNPGGMLNQIGSNYHQSPGFQFALNQAMQGGNRGMAAGGLAGSPSNQMQNMGTATQMGNQDYYNYLQQATGLYGQGLQGQQNMYFGGLDAANNMSNGMAQALTQQGSNAYKGAQNQNQQQGGAFSNLLSGAAAILPFIP